MRPLILASLIMACPGLSLAAAKAPEKAVPSKAAKKAVKWTVAQLVDFVLRKGGDQLLEKFELKDLGYDSDKKSKAVGFDAEHWPDRHSRSVCVFIDEDQKTRGTAKEFLIMTDRDEIKDGLHKGEGWRFRSDLKGNLISAALLTEDADGIRQAPLPLDMPARERFKKELSLLLNESPRLSRLIGK